MTTTFSILRWKHDWYELRIAAAVTITFSIVSTLGRLLSRRMKRRALLFDDWLIMAALIVAVSASTINIWLSKSIDSSAPSEYQETLIQKWAFVTQLHWIVAIALTTHSYLCYLWRYFNEAPQGHKLLWSHITVILWTLGSLLGVIFGLGLPISRYWKEGPGPQYWARLICTTVLHIVIDIAILCIPIPWINGLRLPPFYTTLVFGIFFLGLLTMAATCVRFAYLLKRFHAGTVDRNEFAIFAGMWILIEVNTAVCVANLPTLGPALTWLPKRISGAYKHLSDDMTKKRDENPVGLFEGQKSRSLNPELPGTPRHDPVSLPLMELPSNEWQELG